jgi:uncharacterized protein YjbI with pentapeptide repeats
MGTPIGLEQLTSERSFENGVIAALDIGAASLAGKEFSRCKFRGLKLQEGDLSRAHFEDCELESCDLTRASVAQVLLREVTFRDCKLMGIDWSTLGSYPAMRFEDCNLRYASFVRLGLNKIGFVRCAMVESTFLDTQLVQASFEGSDLTGARFERCTLRGASFASSQGLSLDPRSNDVKGAKVPMDAALRVAELMGLRVCP